MGDRSPAYSSTVSEKVAMARARRLRASTRVLEALVWLIVAGSVAAIGSVHPWAYVPLWGACLVTGLVLVVRTLTAASLKRSLGLRLVAFHQAAVGAQRIYGFFLPLEHGAIFGPFVNRNHFAGYMLMVAFTALGLMARAGRRYRRRVGERPNLRRLMVALSTREGIALV